MPRQLGGKTKKEKTPLGQPDGVLCYMLSNLCYRNTMSFLDDVKSSVLSL